MNFGNKACIGVLALVLALPCRVLAEVRLPGVFSDNMVLQRGPHVAIWGWAEEGEEVTVTFRGQSAKTKATNGKWLVRLARLKAGGPDNLEVAGKNRILLTNVMVGEVWVCSGQSNMEWPLNKSYQSEADIAACANPMLRLLVVQRTQADAPLDNIKGSWKECSPQSVPGFSAVAYYFGRDLLQALKVPVGLIETCWGGTAAEVWINEAVLRANPEYQRDILDHYAEEIKKVKPTDPKRTPWKPAELYNGMIAPLIPYTIKGAIWYQGESNAGRAQQYRSLFADMIRNWRNDWGLGDFPFLIVQLAPYDMNRKRDLEAIAEKPVESNWAELREAQYLATRALPKVGLAVITDVGEKDDIHPKNKAPVGARLALAARGIAYGGKVEYWGPVYKSMKVSGSELILSFDHTDGGLEARDGDLKGFAICGADKKFVWAKAEIRDSKIILSSPEVPQPVAARYGWADYPIVNLWNKAGLPACPFRTDDFPMVTAPKKLSNNR